VAATTRYKWIPSAVLLISTWPQKRTWPQPVGLLSMGAVYWDSTAINRPCLRPPLSILLTPFGLHWLPVCAAAVRGTANLEPAPPAPAALYPQRRVHCGDPPPPSLRARLLLCQSRSPQNKTCSTCRLLAVKPSNRRRPAVVSATLAGAAVPPSPGSWPGPLHRARARLLAPTLRPEVAGPGWPGHPSGGTSRSRRRSPASHGRVRHPP